MDRYDWIPLLLLRSPSMLIVYPWALSWASSRPNLRRPINRAYGSLTASVDIKSHDVPSSIPLLSASSPCHAISHSGQQVEYWTVHVIWHHLWSICFWNHVLPWRQLLGSRSPLPWMAWNPTIVAFWFHIASDWLTLRCLGSYTWWCSLGYLKPIFQRLRTP